MLHCLRSLQELVNKSGYSPGIKSTTLEGHFVQEQLLQYLQTTLQCESPQKAYPYGCRSRFYFFKGEL